MISPPVGGLRQSRRDMSHRRNALRFSIAAVAAASMTGAVASAIARETIGKSRTLTAAIVAALAALSFLYALGDIAGRRLAVPSRHWLVPRDWASFGAKTFSMIFGLFLGAGVFTVVPFIGFYIVLTVCGILLKPAAAAIVLAVFGAMRGLPVWLAAVAVPPEHPLGNEAPLGIVAGYSLADQSIIRALRLLSLLCMGTMLTTKLI